jgi:hypothetical protein
MSMTGLNNKEKYSSRKTKDADLLLSRSFTLILLSTLVSSILMLLSLSSLTEISYSPHYVGFVGLWAVDGPK